MERGSILLESIIAITVLTVGLLGVFSLLSRSLSLNRVIADRYVAMNLAAEGIELIKNSIDTNIIKGLPWNGGLATGEYEIAYNSSLQPTNHRTLNYDESSGLYGYSGNIETRFIREVRIVRKSAFELQVNAIVRWTSRSGGVFDVNLEDHFFNWQ